MSQFFTSVTAGNLPPTVVETLTGNIGGPQSAVANNFNIETANSTVKFDGSAGTLTQDFGLINLILGSSSIGITTADSNAGFGNHVLASLTTGDENAIFGGDSGALITTGSSNTVVGYNAASIMSTGSLNVAVGTSALSSYNSIFGSGRNTVVGSNSAIGLASGINNIILGSSAASNYTGSESSNIIINHAGVLGESNKIRIGTSGSGLGQQNATFIAGITGVTVAGAPVSVSSMGQLASLGFGTAGYQLISSGAGVSPTWVAPSPGANSWTDVTGTTQAMAINRGYLADNAGLVTLTLPATAAQFSIIEVVGHGSGGWLIAQNANQQIIFGNTATSSGVLGSLASTNANDCVKFIASVGGASTVWTVQSSVGNLTVV